MTANDVCFGPDSGLKPDIAPCPRCASNGLMRRSKWDTGQPVSSEDYGRRRRYAASSRAHTAAAAQLAEMVRPLRHVSSQFRPVAGHVDSPRLLQSGDRWMSQSLIGWAQVSKPCFLF